MGRRPDGRLTTKILNLRLHRFRRSPKRSWNVLTESSQTRNSKTPVSQERGDSQWLCSGSAQALPDSVRAALRSASQHKK